MTQYLKSGRTVTSTNGKQHQQQHELQQHLSKQSESDHMTSITFITTGTFSAVTMCIGFALSIILAVIFRFEQTTGTHCRVPNYLPTISAAISTTPSAYVWRLSLCLASLQRLLFVLYRYKWYLLVPSTLRWYSVLCHVCFISELLEHLSLIGLSCISSNDNHAIHEVLFVTFQITSMIHMLFMCVVCKLIKSKDGITSEANTLVKRRGAFRRKVTFCVGNFLSFFISLYFFFRHQNRCEPGVYSLFALFEYLVVVTNILFHYEAWMDFANHYIIYGERAHKN